MAKPATSQPLTAPGMFWRAAGVDDEVPAHYGTLEFDPSGGVRLEVFEGEQELGRLVDETVQGTLLNGTAVTLARASTDRVSSWPVSGASYLKLRASEVAYGLHFASRADVRASTARIRIEGLRSFLNGVVGVSPAAGEKREWEVELPDGSQLSLLLGWDEELTRTSRREELAAGVFIESGSDLELEEWYERWFEPLRHLVSFALGGHVHYDAIDLLIDTPGAADDIAPAIRVAAPDSVWERHEVHVLRRQVRPTGVRTPRDMGQLVAPERLDLEDFIAGFFSLYRRLGRSAPFLFQSVAAPSGFLENRLLGITSAAEAFHRTQHPERPLPDELHEELRSRMRDVLDDDEQRRVYEAPIQYANAASQRTRFRELVNQAAEILPELEPHRKTMPNQLADTRNLYTHLDEEGPNALTDPDDLAQLVERFGLVMELHVLLACGVESEKAADLVRMARTGQGLLD